MAPLIKHASRHEKQVCRRKVFLAAELYFLVKPSRNDQTLHLLFLPPFSKKEDAIFKNQQRWSGTSVKTVLCSVGFLWLPVIRIMKTTVYFDKDSTIIAVGLPLLQLESILLCELISLALVGTSDNDDVISYKITQLLFS